MRTIFATIISTTASIGFTALAVAASAPAVAATVDAMPHAIVQTSDLNLRSEAGKATAERRIDAAAAQVCATGERFATASCRSQARADARQTLAGMTAPERIAAR